MTEKTITFNELRKIKDSLPDGAMSRIAEELGLRVDTVRNYFGADHYDSGRSIGVHLESGPDGGLVVLNDTTILEKALSMIPSKDLDTEKEEPQESPTEA